MVILLALKWSFLDYLIILLALYSSFYRHCIYSTGMKLIVLLAMYMLIILQVLIFIIEIDHSTGDSIGMKLIILLA